MKFFNTLGILVSLAAMVLPILFKEEESATVGQAVTDVIVAIRNTINFPLYVIGNHYIHFATKKSASLGMLVVATHKVLKFAVHKWFIPKREAYRVTIVSSLFVDGMFFFLRVTMLLSLNLTNNPIEPNALRMLWCFDVFTSYLTSCIVTEGHREKELKPVDSESLQFRIYNKIYFISLSFAPQILMLSGGLMFLYTIGYIPSTNLMAQLQGKLAGVKKMMDLIEEHGLLEHKPALMETKSSIEKTIHWQEILLYTVLLPLPAMYAGWFVCKLCISHVTASHDPYDTMHHNDNRNRRQRRKHLQGVAIKVQKYSDHVLWSPLFTFVSLIVMDLTLLSFALLQKDLDIIVLIIVTSFLLTFWASTFYGRLDAFTRTIENQIFRNEDIRMIYRQVNLMLISNGVLLFIPLYAMSFF